MEVLLARDLPRHPTIEFSIHLSSLSLPLFFILLVSLLFVISLPSSVWSFFIAPLSLCWNKCSEWHLIIYLIIGTTYGHMTEHSTGSGNNGMYYSLLTWFFFTLVISLCTARGGIFHYSSLLVFENYCYIYSFLLFIVIFLCLINY